MDDRETILLVDDDPAMLELLRLGLGDHGVATITATGVRDGLAAVTRQDMPVIADVRLPGPRDGIDLLRLLRDGGWHGPGVLITSHATRRLEERAEALGVALLEKPVAAGRLLNLLRHAALHVPGVPEH